MNRKEFIKNSAILSGAAILSIKNVLSQNMTENGIDMLVDSNCNFVRNRFHTTSCAPGRFRGQVVFFSAPHR